MISLPLPLIFAAVIAFLLVQELRRDPRPRLFHGLLALCAMQASLIAAAHHYGLGIGPLLPITACAVPPLAWLAFREALFERVTWRRALPHAAAPLLALVARLMAPALLDLLVPLSFAAYGVAILWALHPGSELPLARLSSGPVPARTWRALAAALLLSTLGDVLITVGYITGHPEWRGPVVSLVTSASLLLTALLALSQDGRAPENPRETAPEAPDSVPASKPEPDPATEANTEDHALVARLDALMAGEKPFLDPDLTLARLARRLRVPVKTLSAAVNRVTAENVSRYVNGHRITEACRLLDEGMPVTEVIYAAGFNTKSNFNREFRRVTGQTPSEHASARPVPTSTPTPDKAGFTPI